MTSLYSFERVNVIQREKNSYCFQLSISVQDATFQFQDCFRNAVLFSSISISFPTDNDLRLYKYGIENRNGNKYIHKLSQNQRTLFCAYKTWRTAQTVVKMTKYTMALEF